MTFFSLIQTQQLVWYKKGCLNFEPINVSKKDSMNILRIFSKKYIDFGILHSGTFAGLIGVHTTTCLSRFMSGLDVQKKA